MRQFILAKDFKAEGAVAGELTIVEATTDSGSEDNVGLNLVLKREASEGGDILYPIYPKDFSYSKAAYNGGATFKASFTVPADVEKGLLYSAIFVRKGTQMNERSNWSFEVRANGSDTATTIAKAIVDFVNGNSEGLGLTATNAEGKVTVTAVKKGEDFAVKLGEELFGQELTEVTVGKPAFMDAEMIKDLAAKCAADAGFEYTYDELDGLYPNLGKSPLAQPDSADTGFDVYTMRFTEPRLMGTREEAVYQIVQVAFPTGKGADFGTYLDENFVVDER